MQLASLLLLFFFAVLSVRQLLQVGTLSEFQNHFLKIGFHIEIINPMKRTGINLGTKSVKKFSISYEYSPQIIAKASVPNRIYQIYSIAPV